MWGKPDSVDISSLAHSTFDFIFTLRTLTFTLKNLHTLVEEIQHFHLLL